MAKVIKTKRGFRAVHAITEVPVGARNNPVPFRKTRIEAMRDANAAACRSGFKRSCARPQPRKRMSSRTGRARRKRRR